MKDHTLIESIARTLYVQEWADREESEYRNRGWAGENLFDLTPETPEIYLLAAWRLVGQIEGVNGTNIWAIVHAAATCDGLESVDNAPEDWEWDLGFCLAMEALGTGVAWTDNHKAIRLYGSPDRPIKIPHFETPDLLDE